MANIKQETLFEGDCSDETSELNAILSDQTADMQLEAQTSVRVARPRMRPKGRTMKKKVPYVRGRGKIYRCSLCPYTTDRKWNLYVSHMSRHTKPLYKCKHCLVTSRLKQTIINHMHKRHGDFFDGRLEDHIHIVYSGMVGTAQSDESFAKVNSGPTAQQNDDSISTVSSGDPIPESEQLPSTQLSTIPSLQMVSASSTSKDLNNSPVRGPDATNRSSSSRNMMQRANFMCEHCEILYFDQALYFMHMGLHTPGSPWKCSVCSQGFNDVYGFSSHLINH